LSDECKQNPIYILMNRHYLVNSSVVLGALLLLEVFVGSTLGQQPSPTPNDEVAGRKRRSEPATSSDEAAGREKRSEPSWYWDGRSESNTSANKSSTKKETSSAHEKASPSPSSAVASPTPRTTDPTKSTPTEKKDRSDDKQASPSPSPA